MPAFIFFAWHGIGNRLLKGYNNLMNIVILGSGITGLTAAEKLSKKFKDKVVVIEKESFAGGLAATFKQDGLIVDFGSHRLHKAVSREMNIAGEMIRKTEKPKNFVEKSEPKSIKDILGGIWTKQVQS